MKYKALVSFGGKVSMHAGEVRELTEKEVINDLLKAGYIEKVETSRKPTRRKKD